MTKRPYYCITYTREGDGYEACVMYVGCNYKAAADRFRFLFNDIKRREFIEEGVTEDNIEQNFHEPPAKLTVGNAIWANINDQDCYWVSIELRAMYLNEFIHRDKENGYKLLRPNAKY